MNLKIYFSPSMMILSGIMQTGCRSALTDDGATSSESANEDVAEVLVEGAVKTAIRHSPITIIKAVK